MKHYAHCTHHRPGFLEHCQNGGYRVGMYVDCLLHLLDKVDKLQKSVDALDALREQVNALWYAPGMPGYQEAHKHFKKKRVKRKKK